MTTLQRSVLAIVVLLTLVLALSCAVTEESVATTPIQVFTIDLVVLGPDGFALSGCALFSGDDVVPIPTGGVQLHVTGPIWAIVYKPGFSPSARTWLEPGEREIVLYPLAKADE